MEKIVEEKMKSFRKKSIKIFILVLVSCLLLASLFGIIDYLRAKNGKKPIFVRTVNVSNFDVQMVGLEDTVFTYPESAVYYGLFYKVSTCDTEGKKYDFLLGNKKEIICSNTLTCTKEYAENDVHTFDYTFYDDKLISMGTHLLIPIDHIDDETSYEKEIIKFNETSGCGSLMTQVDEKTYSLTQVCNITKMSDDDVEKIYSTSKKSLPKTKEEIIDTYSHDKDIKCN